MVQFFLLAFALQANAPVYHITDQIVVMQVKKDVVAASQEEDTFKPYQINLSSEVQKYIWDESKKYGLSFELLLAIAYTESRFNPKAVSYDNSSMGLFQINKRNTVKWLSEQTNIKNVDVFNPYHSTKMAAWYVNYLRKKYLNEGYDEGTVTKRVLTAYRYGMGSSKRKNIDNNYVRAVLEYKQKLERGETNE
ncbi:transglycosylase SLT domain-containing protein [Brevibacillus gelatini]|nr:transglycosylase SLT domain-containing protein [Brevibacillus gelatini]